MHIADVCCGMIGFSRSSGISSRLIRWFTRQDWSHAFIVMPERGEDGLPMILESDISSVSITSLGKYQKSGDHVEIATISSLNTEKGLGVAQTKLGRTYGFFQILGFLPVLLGRRFGIPVKNSYTDGIVCSELVCFYLYGATGDEKWFKMKDDTTPGDLYNTLQQWPKAKWFKMEC